MKTKALHQCLLIILFAVAPCLAGTELPGSSGNLLTDAGFRVRKPETPEQRLIYAVAHPYRMLRAGTPWQSFYVYKDEGEGVAYVGDEVDYQRYQRLAAQEGYRYGFYLAKDLDLDLAWRLSEAFGVQHFWTCRHREELSAK